MWNSRNLNPAIILIFLFLIVSGSAFIVSTGCKSGGPTNPYDTPFTPTATAIIRITGSFNVAVQDKSQAVTGLTVLAIPPSGSVTYSQPTTTTGIATFNPPYLETGNWTLVVPAQTPFPYAQSAMTFPVSVANEQANFNTNGVTIQLTPPVSAQYTGTSGGVFVYGLSYTQSGNLLVPVKLAFPSLPSNWSDSYGPTTIGFVLNDSATVTITGSSCVESSPSFAVTAMDLESPPYPRVHSTTQTITKNFTGTVTVSWYQPNFTNYSSCNLEKQSLSGVLTVSSSNSCASVDVWLNEPSTNCTQGYWNTPKGNTNCNGGHVTFSPGTYSCTYLSDGGFPTFHASCSGNGATGSVVVSNGTYTVLNTSY